MAYLLDTSLLGRLANVDAALYVTANRAVSTLHERGALLYLTPQVLVEFRNFATRPVEVNGLGLSHTGAERKAAIFEAAFPVLPETPDIFPAWKSLVRSLGVTGKQVHDARLAAVCHVHGVTHVLTFNVQHFQQFAAYGPGRVVVDPHNV